MKSRLLLALTAFATVASLATPSTADQWAPVAQYTLGGTVVAKQSGAAPAVDEGALLCQPAAGTGIGGGCVSFGVDPQASSVFVQDDVNGTEVAFQVCLDNNGDGACVSPDEGPCADQIFFSHNDEGVFFNPLGPLPIRFKDGCPGGVWQGYVVFLCNGVHTSSGGGSTINTASAHSHPATSGLIMTTPERGTGFGTFCGGTTADPTNKRYVVS